MKIISRKCVLCGKPIQNVVHTRKYCDDCGKNARHKSEKIHYGQKVKRKPPDNKNPHYGDFSQCKSCVYRGMTTGTCDYYEIVGRRRPCDPSPNCTVYEKGKRKNEQNIK